MKEDGMISKRGYNMAHFSKFVRPGYVRIDATKSPEPNVFVSAYKGNNQVVIVAINKNNAGVNQHFVAQNGSVSQASRWVTSGSSNLQPGTDLNISGNQFWAHLPAQSVTTFVVKR